MLEDKYGNPFTVMFDTIISNVTTTGDKKKYANNLADMINSTTLDGFITAFKNDDYKSSIVSLFGQNFYDTMMQAINAGTIDVVKARQMFRDQATYFSLVATEELASPTALDGMSNAYQAWLDGNESTMYSAFEQMRSEAEDIVEKSGLAKILRDPTSTLAQKDEAAQSLFGKNFA